MHRLFVGMGVDCIADSDDGKMGAMMKSQCINSGPSKKFIAQLQAAAFAYRVLLALVMWVIPSADLGDTHKLIFMVYCIAVLEFGQTIIHKAYAGEILKNAE